MSSPSISSLPKAAPAPRVRPPRILIVDDNPAIHEDFRKILSEPPRALSGLGELEQSLFGSSRRAVKRVSFRLDSAFQGQEGLRMLQSAAGENDPYCLAVVDVRMPPGWDGLETLDHFWECCPELQAVLCTAYSDFSWEEITDRLKCSDNLLILKKPFDAIEALQVAHAMTKKWELGRQARLRMEDLDLMVQEKTRALRLEVDERLHVQETLRHTEERFSKAFHASPLPMAIQSCADNCFRDANRSFLELTAFSAKELIGHSATELKLWQDHDTKTLTAARVGTHARNEQHVLQRRDGKPRTTLMWTEPITVETEASLLVIAEDITDRLKLEGQLRQAQKMEAIGCFATGIAHEFNNLLTVIQGHAGLLRNRSDDPRAGAQSVERITQASVQAASLTRRLLTFSRKQPLQLRPLNLSKALQGMRPMLTRLVGERYELLLKCELELPLVQADEPSWQQVIINLVLNARDAMPDGGTIRLETSALTLDADAARDHLNARSGQFVCVTIADNGCGMTPEVAARVFEPFFTTKEIGKGTGLGLSAVHGIVQQHEGWIQLATQPARGATFKVFLPACEMQTKETRAAELVACSGASCGGGEAVLLVEDEPSVREMARLTLEQGGYRVFQAADGPEALTVWEKSPVTIDLLVTDMTMPNGLTGAALAKALVAKAPRLRAIFTSGYTSELLEDKSMIPIGRFLPKPYDPLTLLRTVKLSLDDETP